MAVLFVGSLSKYPRITGLALVTFTQTIISNFFPKLKKLTSFKVDVWKSPSSSSREWQRFTYLPTQFILDSNLKKVFFRKTSQQSFCCKLVGSSFRLLFSNVFLDSNLKKFFSENCPISYEKKLNQFFKVFLPENFALSYEKN
jgi:hypothetical protein